MFDLSKWTVSDVRAALDRNGYGSEDILSAKYVGVNDYHQAMFDIAYWDDNAKWPDSTGTGRVFVGVNKDGILVGEF